MQGINQLGAWTGKVPSVRDMVVTEFRHQPTKVHLRTYIGERFELTVYRDQEYGELFDLQNDPGERCNLWDEPESAGIRAEMLRRSLNAEVAREPMRLPRIAHA